MANGLAVTAATPATTSTLVARLGVTRGNFVRAAFWTAVIVFFFWCAYKLERDILGRHPGDVRFIREASEAAMRYITIPHIIIGFLFLVSSRNNRNVRSRVWTAGLLLLGVMLCGLYYGGGGRTDLVLSVGVYFYFLVHELRDEAMFYTVLGEAAPIPDRAVFKRFVRWMIALIVGSMVALVLAPAPFGFYVPRLTMSETGLASLGLAATAWFDGSMPLPAKCALAALPVLLVAVGYVYVFRKYARAMGYTAVRPFVEQHSRLFFVMFGLAAVLGLVILLTQRFYALILFHVVAWYIFASHQLGRQQRQAGAPPSSSTVAKPGGWWLWMRTTLPGFRVLHVGMAVVLMAIGLIWNLGMDQSSALAWLLAPESFLYWTIMHITVSFVPR